MICLIIIIYRIHLRISHTFWYSISKVIRICISIFKSFKPIAAILWEIFIIINIKIIIISAIAKISTAIRIFTITISTWIITQTSFPKILSEIFNINFIFTDSTQL